MAFNVSQGAQGAVSGAGMGFSIGGPWGAAAGGALGALSGFYNPEQMEKIQMMTPEQQQHLLQLTQNLGSSGQVGQAYDQSLQNLMDLMDPSSEAFKKFTDPHMRQFEQQTVPGLAERFAGKGANSGALASSGFGQALGAAGAGLQENLASLKANLQQQAGKNIQSLYTNQSGQVLGSRPFHVAEPQEGMGQGLLSGYMNAGAPGLKEAASSYWNQGSAGIPGTVT